MTHQFQQCKSDGQEKTAALNAHLEALQATVKSLGATAAMTYKVKTVLLDTIYRLTLCMCLLSSKCVADEKLAAAQSRSRDDAALIAQLKMQQAAAEQDMSNVDSIKAKLEQQLQSTQDHLAVMDKNLALLKVVQFGSSNVVSSCIGPLCTTML